MNLPWGACAPIILQRNIYIYIYQYFQKVREGRCNINEMWVNPSKGLFLSFCEYHTVCVETSVGSQRPFSWAFFEYHSGCGWVNVYVWERLFGPKGSLLLERQSHLGSFPDRRSMLLKGRFPWIHFTVKERTTLLNQYSLFCSIKKKMSMLFKGKFLWIHFTMKGRTTLLNRYSNFRSIKERLLS